MIISHRYQFIFIKTSKTAGTSIEIGLSKFCGEADVITPIRPADEKLRRNLGYRSPQNYMLGLPQERLPLPDAGRPCDRFYNHSGAKKIRRCIGDIVWNSYYKFAFVRNPWDRFLSYYYWRCRKDPRLPISEFLTHKNLRRMKRLGSNLYSIKGEIAVDRLCRYENLDQELDELCRRLGFPEAITLPQAKSTFRPDKRSYRQILTGEQAQKIADFFQEEIERFGYEF